MHAVVSQTVDVDISSARRTSQNRKQSLREIGSPVEILRTIPTTSLSDVASVAMTLDEVTPRERSEGLGRAINLIVAVVALVVLSPLMLLVALTIRLTSSGPIFYRQTRVGLDRRGARKLSDERRRHDHGGKVFEMYKFRTMRADAESMAEPFGHRRQTRASPRWTASAVHAD